MLTVFPKWNIKKVLQGDFQKKYEDYLSDQFWERDKWIAAKNYTERCLGKKETNGVYFGKEDYLFEKYQESDFDKKLIKKNVKILAKAVKRWEKRYGKEHIRTLFVPMKEMILSDKIPAFAPQYDESEFLDFLEKEIPEPIFLSAKKCLLEKKKEEIFYRTDHHWTTQGAYFAYQLWAESMKITPWEENEYVKKKVSNEFQGSTYSKVNMGGKKDVIYLYYPKKKLKYSVNYNMGEWETDSLYDMSMLKKKDKYAVFFGGNQGIIEITTNVKNGKTLFVVKDSFANSFLPFAANHFEKTVVIDLRFVNAHIDQIMKIYKPTDILLLYNTVQFMQSKDINKLN